jgi:citrate lyase beta subunit
VDAVVRQWCLSVPAPEHQDGAGAANRRARDLGFDGRWVIHRRQVDPAVLVAALHTLARAAAGGVR